MVQSSLISDVMPNLAKRGVVFGHCLAYAKAVETSHVTPTAPNPVFTSRNK